MSSKNYDVRSCKLDIYNFVNTTKNTVYARKI